MCHSVIGKFRVTTVSYMYFNRFIDTVIIIVYKVLNQTESIGLARHTFEKLNAILVAFYVAFALFWELHCF